MEDMASMARPRCEVGVPHYSVPPPLLVISSELETIRVVDLVEGRPKENFIESS